MITPPSKFEWLIYVIIIGAVIATTYYRIVGNWEGEPVSRSDVA